MHGAIEESQLTHLSHSSTSSASRPSTAMLANANRPAHIETLISGVDRYNPSSAWLPCRFGCVRCRD